METDLSNKPSNLTNDDSNIVNHINNTTRIALPETNLLNQFVKGFQDSALQSINQDSNIDECKLFENWFKNSTKLFCNVLFVFVGPSKSMLYPSNLYCSAT